MRLAIYASEPGYTGVIEGFAFENGVAWVHGDPNHPAVRRLAASGCRITDADAEPEHADLAADTEPSTADTTSDSEEQ